MKFWKQITDRMAMLCLDLEKLPQVAIAMGPLEWVTTGYDSPKLFKGTTTVYYSPLQSTIVHYQHPLSIVSHSKNSLSNITSRDSDQDGYRQMGLASAWRGELWQALRVSPAPPKSATTSAHWGNLQNEMEPQIADERHEKGCVYINRRKFRSQTSDNMDR
jgi:hypothetical protein